jgi:hypothetical protein
MLTHAQIESKSQAVNQVLDFMHQRRLSPDDLINLGGAELKSKSAAIRAKANSVDKCWSLMASLGIKHVDLEPAGQSLDKAA